MKGFVPVTKYALSEMLAECLDAIKKDFQEKYLNRIDRYSNYEEKRTKTRKWYRLWLLPKARFDINNTQSIIDYSANRKDYEMFEGCPLKYLEKDKENSIKWVMRLIKLVESEYSGEPILLDIKTFNRISNPFSYNWVDIGMFYTLEKS